MVKEMQPEDTTRAMAYELWLNAPNPMVTFFKTLDVTNLIKISRKKGRKLHMLLDYCIGKAAVSIKEFYILPVGDKLMQYDTLAVNTIVKNKQGEVSSCDRSDDFYRCAVQPQQGNSCLYPVKRDSWFPCGHSLPVHAR